MAVLHFGILFFSLLFCLAGLQVVSAWLASRLWVLGWPPGWLSSCWCPPPVASMKMPWSSMSRLILRRPLIPGLPWCCWCCCCGRRCPAGGCWNEEASDDVIELMNCLLNWAMTFYSSSKRVWSNAFSSRSHYSLEYSIWMLRIDSIEAILQWSQHYATALLDSCLITTPPSNF